MKPVFARDSQDHGSIRIPGICCKHLSCHVILWTDTFGSLSAIFYKENRPYDPKIERLEIAHKEVVELVDDIDW